MTFTRLVYPAVLLAGLILATSCSRMLATEKSIGPSHPEPLGTGRPVCSECHEGGLKGSDLPYATLDHSAQFVRQHNFAAGPAGATCGVCHAVSFCNDCHANRIEVKPSTKLGDRPDRELIHRGDYLTRHKIDGKIDPTSCYRCHGRANNEKCITCHR